MSSRRKQMHADQISIYDMVLKPGDKLFRDGSLYGEITGESESLYFVMKANSKEQMPIPYQKQTLLNNILMGKLNLASCFFD